MNKGGRSMLTHKLSIQNIQEEDEKKIREALYDVWGVRDVELNTETGEATISYNEQSGSIQDFQQAIIDLGYEANKLEE
ncbi:MAG: heavy-metal-associated domain-containing protein [Bacillus sp. (in: Bacteria)]|nr:heavy-metal-associated domain-containing protein [Bacillus sp. (in: firmicutes)]